MIELISTDFVLMALAAGLALAVVAGPLGSFLVWRRMSYFGDTLAHATLLGIAVGLLTGSNPQLSIILCSLVFAGLLVLLEKKPGIASDALLGIIAHSTLALGIILLALTDAVRIDLEAYLFGALLTIGPADLLWVVLVAAVVAIVLFKFWNSFVSFTVHPELAAIEGENVDRLYLLLVLLIALTIAVSMKIIGVLLITSLLIIPPAAARRLARTPEQMALGASALGAISVVAGLIGAFYLDTPVGPTIVVMATILFVAIHFAPSVLHR
ncbi:MAG: metal ABC transporter permease [Gammaproteobacteria bacterium]